MKSNSQKLYSKLIAATVLTSAVVVPVVAPVGVSAEETTSGAGTTTTVASTTTTGDAATVTAAVTSAEASNILGTKKDTVIVKGLTAKDVVKVYSDVEQKNPIGTATASATNAAALTVKITKGFDIDGGTVYVTRKAPNLAESKALAVTVAGEERTATPDTAKIIVKNAKETKYDTLTVKDTTAGDVINVYADNDFTKKPIGTAKAPKAGGDVIVKIKAGYAADIALGQTKDVYVTVTATGKAVSKPVAVAVGANYKTDRKVTSAVAENKLGAKSDTMKVTGLEKNDLVKIFTFENNTKEVIFEGKASKAGEQTFKLKNGFPIDGGKVYVSRTAEGMEESDGIDVLVTGEERTTTSDSAHITTKNGLDKKFDTVTISKDAKLAEKTTVKVYKSKDITDKNNLIGTAKVSKDATKDVVVKISKGFASDTEDTKIYVTYTADKKAESHLQEVTVAKSAPTKALATEGDTSTVVATNDYAAKGDKIVVKKEALAVKDVVNVYKSATFTKENLIGTAKVSKLTDDVTVKISKGFDIKGGKVYVTRTSEGLSVSEATIVNVKAEKLSATPDTAHITTKNGLDKKFDTVTISKDAKLAEKTTVKVYKSAVLTKENLIGTAKVSKDATKDVVVKISKGFSEGDDKDQKVYVTYTEDKVAEGEALEVTVAKTATSTALTASGDTAQVTLVNGYLKADTVTITKESVQAKDVVNVYKSTTFDKANLIGTAKISKVDKDIVIKISKGLEANSKVYVTRTTEGLKTSEALELTVGAEPKTEAPKAADLTASDAAKTVTFKAAKAKDVVTVYSDAALTKKIGTAKAGSAGGSVVVKISGGFTYEGTASADTATVYVTVTSDKQHASEATPLTVTKATTTAVTSTLNVAFATNVGKTNLLTATNATGVLKFALNNKSKAASTINVTAVKPSITLA